MIDGAAGLIDEDAETDPRDYDVEHYVRLLRETFASRLARAFTPDDFATLFDDPDQLSLFAKPIASIRPILTRDGNHELNLSSATPHNH